MTQTPEADTKQATHLLTIQRDLGYRLSATDNLEKALSYALHAFMKTRIPDACAIYHLNYEQDAGDVIVQKGFSDEYASLISHFSLQSPQMQAIAKGKIIYTSHQEFIKSLEVPFGAIRKEECLQAIGIIPIVYHESVLAAIYIASKTASLFSDQDRLSLETITHLVSGTFVRIHTQEEKTNELKKSEQKLHNRLAYESALNNFSNMLINKTQKPSGHMEKALEFIREVSNADRAYIFENFIDTKDGLCMRQIHEKTAPGVTRQFDNPVLQHIPYKSGAMRWKEYLSKKKIIHGIVKNFPRSERVILEPEDIKSILIVPIFQGNQWYGFIGFDNTSTQTLWKEEDVNLLRQAANTLGLYFQQQQSQADLVYEKERFQTILDHIPVMITYYDPHAQFELVNKEFTKLIGWKPDEVNKIDLMAKCFPDKEYRNELIDFMMSGTKLWKDITMTKKDGSLLETSWSNVKLSNGKQIGIGLDNTEKKRAQLELQESERRYRTVAENFPNGAIFFFNNKYEYIFVDGKALKQFGWSKDTFIGKKIGEALPEDIVKQVMPYAKKIMKGEEVTYTIHIQDRVFINYGAPIQTEGDNVTEGLVIVEDITDIMQTHQEMKESEQFLQTLIDTMPNPMFYKDADGVYLGCNRAFEQFLGIDRQRIIGHTVYDVASHELADVYHTADLSLIHKKGKQKYEADVQTAEGTRHVIFNKATFPNADGKGAGGMVGIIIDITERKKIEDMLRQYEKAVQQSPASIVITDIEGNIQYVNPAFCKISGYTSEEALGNNPRVLKSGKQSEEFYKNLWDTILAGKLWQGEFENKKKNGERYWETAQISPLTDETGRITNFIAVKKDITEKKLYESKMFEEKEKLRHILQSIGDGVFVIDKDKKIVLANKTTTDLSEYSEEELIGSPLSDKLQFIVERTGKPYTHFIDLVYKDGVNHNMNYDTMLVSKSGKHIPVKDSAAPIKNNNGDTIGCVVVFRDISEEYELNKLKTDFVTVTSHQLRTPLTGVKWNLELLLEEADELNSDHRTILSQLFENNERLISMVNQLLSISEIEDEQRSKGPKSTFSLPKLISEIKPSIQSPMSRKSITLVSDIPDGIKITAPRESYKKAINNILDNAVRYAFPHTQVTLSYEVTDIGQVLFITNHGFGILEEDKNKVFTKFFRSKEAMKQETEGNGLGLYIAKSLVEAQGGSITFKSEENKTTTFIITVPR